jgi:hypothetical protein
MNENNISWLKIDDKIYKIHDATLKINNYPLYKGGNPYIGLRTEYLFVGTVYYKDFIHYNIKYDGLFLAPNKKGYELSGIILTDICNDLETGKKEFKCSADLMRLSDNVSTTMFRILKLKEL